MNVRLLKKILPEWEFEEFKDEGGTGLMFFDPRRTLQDKFDTINEEDLAYLEWLVERALLKDERVVCVESSLRCDGCTVTLYLDEDRIEHGHDQSQLSALLKAAEPLYVEGA